MQQCYRNVPYCAWWALPISATAPWTERSVVVSPRHWILGSPWKKMFCHCRICCREDTVIIKRLVISSIRVRKRWREGKGEREKTKKLKMHRRREKRQREGRNEKEVREKNRIGKERRDSEENEGGGGESTCVLMSRQTTKPHLCAGFFAWSLRKNWAKYPRIQTANTSGTNSSDQWVIFSSGARTVMRVCEFYRLEKICYSHKKSKLTTSYHYQMTIMLTYLSRQKQRHLFFR